MVTWIGIFPVVYVYERVVSWIMPTGTPILLRIAVITALVVPTMSYLVSPQLTRLSRSGSIPVRVVQSRTETGPTHPPSPCVHL